MRLVFQTDRTLFDSHNAGESLSVAFYLCSSAPSTDQLWGFGSESLGVMWNGRVVTSEIAKDIAGAVAAKPQPQRYEIFFSYVYWDRPRTWSMGEPVTLLPLPEDLCLAMYRLRMPFPSTFGRPMRISKSLVNAAVGPLPRPLPVVGDEPN